MSTWEDMIKLEFEMVPHENNRLECTYEMGAAGLILALMTATTLAPYTYGMVLDKEKL